MFNSICTNIVSSTYLFCTSWTLMLASLVYCILRIKKQGHFDIDYKLALVLFGLPLVVIAVATINFSKIKLSVPGVDVELEKAVALAKVEVDLIAGLKNESMAELDVSSLAAASRDVKSKDSTAGQKVVAALPDARERTINKTQLLVLKNIYEPNAAAKLSRLVLLGFISPSDLSKIDVKYSVADAEKTRLPFEVVRDFHPFKDKSN